MAVIGTGGIGRKRAHSISRHPHSKVSVVCDVDGRKAESLAGALGCEFTTDPAQTLTGEVDVVVVSTVNKFLTPLALEALNGNKHVLCEKPLGRNSQESLELCRAASQNRCLLKTGFNHRFHPAVYKARELAQDGSLGKLLTLRARYGHGGRPGMEKEWRCNPDLSGGGELLDQGVHCFDLFRWFAGDFELASGWVEHSFWNSPVEDNAFGLFRSPEGIVAQFHVSWTQWKNLFSFEVFGTEGFLQIEGLGGSYGSEKLLVGKRASQGECPEVKQEIFEDPDCSWDREWESFANSLDGKSTHLAGGVDGLRANEMVEAIYSSAREQRVLRIANRDVQNYTLTGS